MRRRGERLCRILIDEAFRRPLRLQDHHVLAAHQGEVLVVLHDGAARPVGGHAGQILAEHGVVGADPHQGEQGRRHVDLADDAQILSRRYAVTHDDSRNVEAGMGTRLAPLTRLS